MKKILFVLFCFTIVFSSTVYADDTQILMEKLNEIWLSPIEESDVLENIMKINQQKAEEDISMYLIAPGYAREQIGISADDEIMRQQVTDKYSIKDNILKVYDMKTNLYAKQYAECSSLRYLLSDDYYWFMKTGDYYQQYEKNGELYNVHKEHYTTIGPYILTEESMAFLLNSKKIYEVLEEAGISTISDIKCFSLSSQCTCIYIDCDSKEYIVRIYTGSYRDSENHHLYHKWASDIEEFKLYEAKDLLEIISTSMNELNEIKPTYESEAQSLQEDGLLKGNEKGLDLLKPLTRIEATAILVRAMGFENESTSTTSYFADIASDNWGAKYANIAKDKGIATGVGDNMFAPNNTITASQFVTLILRNLGETPDWQTAVNLFVERGLITQEQADKMDLFTRGDMAKIIYEARRNSII